LHTRTPKGEEAVYSERYSTLAEAYTAAQVKCHHTSVNGNNRPFAAVWIVNARGYGYPQFEC
jgi:hypothetical protein